MTSLLSPSFSFSFPFCVSPSFSLFCPLSFLPAPSPSHLAALYFLQTNLSSIWLRSLFQSSLSPALFLCALSSHSFAHFIRSRCTSKLHKSRAPCISLSLFPFLSLFFFFFPHPACTEFIFHFLCYSHLSHQLSAARCLNMAKRHFITASKGNSIYRWLPAAIKKTARLMKIALWCSVLWVKKTVHAMHLQSCWLQ